LVITTGGSMSAGSVLHDPKENNAATRRIFSIFGFNLVSSKSICYFYAIIDDFVHHPDFSVYVSGWI
jgi:hypothetical protein